MERWCSYGKHSVDISSFWKRKNGYQPYCIDCQKSANTQRYRLDSASHIKLTRRNTKKRLDLFQTWKRTLSCTICAESYSKCLDFHHMKKKKDFALSNSAQRYGWAKVITELQKCIVVCKNCHTKIHDGVIQLQKDHPVCDVGVLKVLIKQ